MKKAILLSILCGLFSTAIAQNCTPDQGITEPGIYPRYVDTGMVGQTYQHVFQILAPKDTLINSVTALVDSIAILAINGLPASFSHACEPVPCVFTWENVGCAVLNGNPTATEAGEHPLEIVIRSYARLGSIQLPVTDTLEDFVLVIEDSATVSVQNTLASSQFTVTPNPSSTGIFKYSSKISGDLIIYDQQGREVLALNHSELKGTIDLSEQARGIYYLWMFSNDGVLTYRLVY